MRVVYSSFVPVTAAHKKRTPKTMKTMLEPIFTYFIGIYREITVPTAMPIAVTSASASITPMKTVSGASYSAASAVTDNCVLSPSSASAIMPNEATRGSKSMSEGFRSWSIESSSSCWEARTCGGGGKLRKLFVACKNLLSVLIDKYP